MFETEIDRAVEQFHILLEEQLARQARMEQASPAKDYAHAGRIVIGVCGGDGIGPILMRETRRILEVLLRDRIASGQIVLRDIEGLTLENRLAKGEAVPRDVLAAIRECDVLLKGPTATPKGGTLESANVALRRELDLYANVRPVTVKEEGIDWIFFRENTEGEYVARQSRGGDPRKAGNGLQGDDRCGNPKDCARGVRIREGERKNQGCHRHQSQHHEENGRQLFRRLPRGRGGLSRHHRRGLVY